MNNVNFETTFDPEVAKIHRDWQKTEWERVRREMTLAFSKCGEEYTIPSRSGSAVQFRTMQKIDAVATNLAEGITPDANKVSIDVSVGTVVERGITLTVTNRFYNEVGNRAYEQLIKTVTVNMQESVETYYAQQAMLGTNVFYGNGSVNAQNAVTAAMGLSVNSILKAMTIMRTNNVQPCMDGFFRLVINPAAAAALMADPDWRAMANQDNTVTKQEKGVIGNVYGCKLIVSNYAPAVANAGAAGISVNRSFLCGATGFTRINIANEKPRIITKPLGYGDDPLNQRGSVSWDGVFGAKIVDPLSCLRLETA